ncbi:DNA-directed RNA polymerase subunit K [Nanobdella aerobiophila]|uniref:DNA-directed RNA polymerase subunit K n=1 Tax=Nanobdella aerobiophila TaxID=2586965 RepID=A0A915S9X3_9ARCH|nr:DNA-directed RNA polymerase subunit K [Nanobdella aerobiophila]BBL45337.1 DNA-directed RNA polymerase subunit K [Nanobdella aerobiophila]
MSNNSRFAIARLIGARALQISMGAPIMVKLSKEDLERINYNPVKIAMIEYEKGVLPLRASFKEKL